VSDDILISNDLSTEEMVAVSSDIFISMAYDQTNHHQLDFLDQQQLRPVYPDTSSAGRPSREAPLIKLSVDLIKTYKQINQVIQVLLLFLIN